MRRSEEESHPGGRPPQRGDGAVIEQSAPGSVVTTRTTEAKQRAKAKMRARVAAQNLAVEQAKVRVPIPSYIPTSFT